MYILDDGIRLNAKLEMPKAGAEKCPLVIIIHGFTGHMEEAHLTALSQALNENGAATLRVDMYGHGHSEGQFRDHTLYKWLTNALTVIDYARALPFVSDIYLCGHSQGGLTAVLAGGMAHDRLRGIIALAPACMIPENARRGELLGTRFDPMHPPETLNVWNDWVLGGNYVRVAQTLHVEEAEDRFRGPVLIVQDERDDPSLIQSARDAANRYQNSVFELIPGCTHCFGERLDAMVDAVIRWILPLMRPDGAK